MCDLIFRRKEVPVASLHAVDAVVEQESNHGRVLVHDGHVKNILT
jgi:hypothetical protein